MQAVFSLAPMLASLFGINEASLEAEAEVGDQAVEAGANDRTEERVDDHLVEGGSASLEDKARADD